MSTPTVCDVYRYCNPRCGNLDTAELLAGMSFVWLGMQIEPFWRLFSAR